MARRRLSAAVTDAPPPEEVFWRTAAFRWGTLLTAAVASFFLLTWFERENRHYLQTRRLEEDARLGPLARQLAARIEEAENSGALKDLEAAERNRVPRALWLGRVKEFTEVRDASGRLTPEILTITDATLLKGARGRGDARHEFKAARKDYVFHGTLPKPGEIWLLSVWRNREGYNYIHSAARWEGR